MLEDKTKIRAKPRTHLQIVTALLDWYEIHKPDREKRVQVCIPPQHLAKFAKLNEDEGVWDYRGWKLINTFR
jgi:hypothetical protein